MVIVFYLIRPAFSKMPFFAKDRNRLLILTIPLGLFMGWWAEYSSCGVQFNIVLRRGYAMGAAAAWAILFAKVFCHSINIPYPMMDPAPSASAGTRS